MDTLKNSTATADKAAAAAEAKAAKAAKAEAKAAANKAAAEAAAKAEAEAAAEAAAAATTEAEAAEAAKIAAELSKLLPSVENVKTAIVTKRQVLNHAVKTDVNGLGSMFTSLRRNKAETLAFLEDQKSKGKKIDVSKVRAMLYEGNFNLFRAYLTEKESSQQTFTANQTTAIFLRACLAE